MKVVRTNNTQSKVIDTEESRLIHNERTNGACAHYVMVSKFQWKPFWLATQQDPQNDWTATQNPVNYDVFAQAPFVSLTQCFTAR